MVKADSRRRAVGHMVTGMQGFAWGKGGALVAPGIVGELEEVKTSVLGHLQLDAWYVFRHCAHRLATKKEAR
jgi:hypothetical protein